MFLLLKWTVMYIIIITSTETTNLENFPLTASPVSKLLIRKKLNFRWPQNRKLFSSRFINAVHLAHAQMMMNCFCGMVDRRKRFSLISNRDYCKKSLPSSTHREQIWTYAETEFRLCWMKLCNGDDHYTTTMDALFSWWMQMNFVNVAQIHFLTKRIWSHQP